ncbi:hypothetical protein ABZP36_008887 [Zizania latifolia]
MWIPVVILPHLFLTNSSLAAAAAAREFDLLGGWIDGLHGSGGAGGVGVPVQAPRHRDPSDLTLQDYCFQNLPEVASRPCLIDGQSSAVDSYAEVEELSRRAAAGLGLLGVGKGDVVMNLLRNCPEFTFTFLGAARLGAATTTANPFYTPHEIHRQAAAAGTKVIVTEARAILVTSVAQQVLLAGMRAGSVIVIMRKFDLGALVDLTRTHGVTIVPFVPPIVVEIAKSPCITADDLASICMVMSGAAPMGRDLQDAIMAKIPNAVLDC